MHKTHFVAIIFWCRYQRNEIWCFFYRLKPKTTIITIVNFIFQAFCIEIPVQKISRTVELFFSHIYSSYLLHIHIMKYAFYTWFIHYFPEDFSMKMVSLHFYSFAWILDWATDEFNRSLRQNWKKCIRTKFCWLFFRFSKK